jgi:hypothetical protein
MPARERLDRNPDRPPLSFALRSGLSRALALAVLALTLTLCSQGRSLAGDLRAAKHPDFARLVFEFDDPVSYTAEIVGGRLSLVFDRPIPGNPQAAAGVLDGYVSGASLSLDRKSATFPLTGSFRLRTFTTEGAVVVDLQRYQGSLSDNGASQARTQAGPSGMGGSATVPVRVGDHDEFSRLVFDWSSPVEYKVTKQGELVTVQFERPGRVDIESLRGQLPLYVSGAESANSRTPSVTLFVASSSRIRHFTSGPKVVVDVLRPEGGETTPPRAAKPAAPAPLAPQRQPAAATAPQAAAPAPLVPKAPQAEQAASAKSGEEAPSEPPKPAQPITDKGMPTDLLALAKQGQIQIEQMPGQAKAAPGQPSGQKPSQPPSSGAGGPGAGGPGAGAAGAEPPAKPAGNGSSSALVAPSIADDDEEELPPASGPPKTASLSFTWNQPAAAAIFRRSGYLWVVFDRYLEVDLRLQRQLGGDLIHTIEQMPSKSSTILRMVVEPGYNPSIRKENLLWILDFTRQPLRPAKPLEVKLQPESASGARLFMAVTEAGATMPMIDPEMGDQLYIVPLVGLGIGVYPSFDFPEVELLATAQGVVAVRKGDGVEARSNRNGVEIARIPGGLHFTREQDRAIAAVKSGQEADTSAFNAAKWQQGEPDKFLETLRELTLAAGSVPPELRSQTRLTLARFMVANGQGAEALGVLRTLALADSSVVDTAPFRAVRGAANTLQHRTDEAVEDFSHPSLSGNGEAMFWKAVALAEADIRPGRFNDAMKESGGYLREYPDALKKRLGSSAAEAANNASDDLSAQRLMEFLQPIMQTPQEKQRYDYLDGGYQEITGAFDSALEKYKLAEQGPGRYERARAGLARVEMLMGQRRMTKREGIAELERLRFAWRGDDFEFNLLRRLAELYFEERDYAGGLRTLKQVASAFRDHREFESVAGSMSDAFARLYLQGEVDKLPPVSAIALFDEFKELTPVGPRGDEMIRRLADRLASVDLLDKAAELLQQQMRFRLKGEDKSRVGYRQALLNLLNRQPNKALEALNESETPSLPEELQRQRNLLRARVLAEMDRMNDALLILEADPSRDARLLTAELWWNRKDWAKAALAFESLVPRPELRPEKGGQLTDQQARFTLNWAVALILAGDDRGLGRLRRVFQPYMDGTPYRDAFTLLTSEPGTEGIDSSLIAAKIKEVENFQNFMTTYRERLRTERLSAIN